eukprot:gene13914-biopygen3557
MGRWVLWGEAAADSDLVTVAVFLAFCSHRSWFVRSPRGGSFDGVGGGTVTRTTIVVSAVPPWERPCCNPPRGRFGWAASAGMGGGGDGQTGGTAESRTPQGAEKDGSGRVPHAALKEGNISRSSSAVSHSAKRMPA